MLGIRFPVAGYRVRVQGWARVGSWSVVIGPCVGEEGRREGIENEELRIENGELERAATVGDPSSGSRPPGVGLSLSGGL